MLNLGLVCRKIIEPSKSLSDLHVYIALGMIFSSYIFVILGLLDVINRNSLILCGTASQLCALTLTIRMNNYRNTSLVNYRKVSKYPNFRILLFVIPLLPIIFAFRNPITGYDALAYHLYLPWNAINFSHSLSADLLIPNAGLPIGSQGINSWLILFFNYKFAQIPNLYFILATIHLIFNKFYSDKNIYFKKIEKVCLFLVVLALLTASGRIVLTSSSSDIALVFFFLIFLRVALQHPNQENYLRDKALWLIGGFLIFVKPFAAVAVIPSLFVIGWKKKWTPKFCITSSIPAFVIYFWWVVKTYLVTNNPFFPLFQGVFKGVGFGPEVLTNEEDVRRSFGQLLNFTQNIAWSITGFSTAQMQILVSTGIVCFSIYRIFLCYRDKSLETVMLKLVILSYLILIFYIGPIYRYVLFLNFAQLYLSSAVKPNVVSQKYIKEMTKSISLSTQKHLRTINNYLPRISVILTSLFLFVNLDSTYRDLVVSDQPPPKSLQNENISTNEVNFRKVILFLENDKYQDSKIALFGEGRAALFFPRDVVVYPNDRRNPFATHANLTHDDPINEIKSSGVDVIVISSVWGWPQSINSKKMIKFKQENKNLLIFSIEGWDIYGI